MEVEQRARLLKRMVEENIIEIRDIAREIYTYYIDPEKVLRKYGVEPGLIPVAEKPEPIKAAETAGGVEKPATTLSSEQEEEIIAENILNILKANNGTYPLWKIFIETPTSKITVFKALKKLRESGVIEMSRSIVRLVSPRPKPQNHVQSNRLEA